MSIDKLVHSYVQESTHPQPTSKSATSSPDNHFSTNTSRSQITSTIRCDTETLGSRTGGRPQSYHFGNPPRGGSRIFVKIEFHINNLTSVSIPPSPLQNPIAPDKNTNDVNTLLKS